MANADRLLGSLHVEDGPISVATRRQVLAGLGVSTAGAVAGCLGDDTPGGDDDGTDSDDGTGDDEPGEFVDGATLRLVTTHSPATTTFLGTGAFPFPSQVNSSYFYPDWANHILFDYGMWGEWSSAAISSGGARMLLYEDVSIESDEINVTLKSDATWSNGDEVNGRDVLTMPIAFRMFPGMEPVPDVAEGSLSPEEIGVIPAITDVEWSGKEATFISEGDYFDEYREQDIWYTGLTKWDNWGGIHCNTRVEPHDTWSEWIWDTWESAKAGENDPWAGDPTVVSPGHVPVEEEWGDIQRDPTNTAFSGPWQLEQMTDAEIRLTPNEHYRDHDELNFDEVVIEFRPEGRANWASLNAGRLDFYDEFMPEDVAGNLPGKYEDRLAETDWGLHLWMDHTSPFFQDVNARRAFLHILDTGAIAEANGPAVNEPITTPGADLWGADEWLSDSFVENNLRSYEQDFGKAAELLEAAGWSEQGDGWYLPTGEKAQLEIPTADSTPRWEVAVTDQLNEFGIDTELRILSAGVLSNRRIQGDFDLWEPGGDAGMQYQVGFFQSAVGKGWMFTVIIGHWAQLHNIFPQEQIDDAEYVDNPAPNQDLGPVANNDQYAKFSLEAPAVGDWDGDLQSWNAPDMGRRALHPAQTIDRESLFQELAWLTNWYVPVLPLTNHRERMATNTGDWSWPAEDSEDWGPVGVDKVKGLDMVGLNKIFARPSAGQRG